MRKSLWCLTLLFTLVLSLFAAGPPTADVDPLPHGATARLGPSRWGTGTYVYDLAYSPDGKFIATADGYVRTARIWDADTGRVVHTLWGHREGVVNVAYSSDGKRLLTCGTDKSVRIWDTATGESVRKIDLDAPAQLGRFTADDKGLVIVDNTGLVLRFDVEGRPLGRIRPSVNTNTYRAISARGDRVAMVTIGMIRLRLSDAEDKQGVEIEIGNNTSMPFMSPDGKRVAMRLNTPAIKVWDATTGKEVMVLGVDEAGKSGGFLAFSPDSKTLLGEVEQGKVRLWDVATGKRIAELAGTNLNVSARAFSPDGKRIVLSGNSAGLRVFDGTNGTRLNEDNQADGFIRSLAFSPDSKLLLSGGTGSDGIALWDLKSRKVVRRLSLAQLPPYANVSSVAFSRDGKRAVAVGYNFPIFVWDVESGKELHRINVVGKSLISAHFSADGDTLFASAYSEGVLRWDLKTGNALSALKSQRYQYVSDMQLSDDGKTLAAHANGATVYWDAITGTEQRTLVLNAYGRRLSSDWKKFAGADQQGRLNFYDSTNGNLLHGWPSVNTSVLRLSPDDKQVAVAAGRFVRVYESDGKPAAMLMTQSGSTSALAYSPDGKWLALSDGSSVLLYDVATLKQVPKYRLSKGQWQWCLDTIADKQGSYLIPDAEAMLHSAGDGWTPVLRERLTLPPFDAKKAEKLIKVAVGDDETAAERALTEIVTLGPGVRPMLEGAAKNVIDPDVKLKLIVARAKIIVPDAEEETRRAPRMVAILRHLATKDAEALLADMADGKYGDVWQNAAKAKQ